jgi:hypothetical protein
VSETDEPTDAVLDPIGDDSDEAWNDRARGETATQRLDRNWNSLVQELRVLQTGVQLLAGFLMIVPFQAGFAMLHSGGHALYLVTVSAATLAVILLLSPIAMHRLLFRRHQLAIVVTAAHRYVLLGMAAVAISTTGAFSMVALAATKSGWAAVGAGVPVGCIIIALWVWVPLRSARRNIRRNPRERRNP